MISLVSLLAATLVSLQCCHSASTLIDSKNLLENTLQPNALPPKRKSLKPFVSIVGAPPERARLPRGAHAELACAAVGHPAPRLRWLRNGEPVDDYEESANEIVSAHPSSIAEVRSALVLRAAAAGDVFSCVARAGARERVASTTVLVEEAGDELSALQALLQRATAPIPTYSYAEAFQNMGTSLVLPCRAFSYSGTRVRWAVNGVEVTQSPNMRVLPSGDLLISSLDFSDMGNYSCTVENLYGETTVSTFVYPLKVKD
ncbi:neural/ectodermal development factor IMP-L2 [Amyelois transitella]|uniref:neural/ectodermal development factor IMP-L2 n=1 Tax=Amyelois transitella TaxID=680683 RepID=UPI00067BD01B|nr:neural/ectodermal development factor IMP-L2 [Amyelois transitella]XP_013194804.1 neural/ectodermal development factor IMP-L2 [Amyelois transitella]